ncbi:CPBP family intramembrane glutamic endopeptidase [Virgibacillus xinjiangensis]|uniref:CPBP family intramembrane glutamic endopeptidase n=1 Tax=Virgibacillus xinjiangensis TaxID=393090 RepID=A0ABV7CRM7_9BACI
MKQSEIVRHLTDAELRKQLFISQLFLLIIAFLLSIFLFDTLSEWMVYWHWDSGEIFQYGVIPGLIIVSADLILMILLPKSWYDDGGINERIFKRQPLLTVIILVLLVAVSEELLFRGVLQTVFGYIPASILFALVHIRYLYKPVLLISVLFVSFYIGYLFHITDNLAVTITAHFTVDLLLALVIRLQK